MKKEHLLASGINRKLFDPVRDQLNTSPYYHGIWVHNLALDNLKQLKHEEVDSLIEAVLFIINNASEMEGVSPNFVDYVFMFENEYNDSCKLNDKGEVVSLLESKKFDEDGITAPFHFWFSALTLVMISKAYELSLIDKGSNKKIKERDIHFTQDGALFIALALESQIFASYTIGGNRSKSKQAAIAAKAKAKPKSELIQCCLTYYQNNKNSFVGLNKKGIVTRIYENHMDDFAKEIAKKYALKHSITVDFDYLYRIFRK